MSERQPPSSFDQLATLERTAVIEAPSPIPPRGYRFGFVDRGALICCDAVGVYRLDLDDARPPRRLSALACTWATPVAGGYVLEVPRAGAVSPRDGNLVFLPDDDAPVRVVPYRGYVKYWSPDDDELATFDQGRYEVRRWPSMEVVCSVFGHHPSIDWDERVLLFTDEHRHVLQPFDPAQAPRYLDFDRDGPQPLYLLGDGIAESNLGFTLLGLRAGWRTDLFDPHPDEGFLSLRLTPDGRGVRTVIGRRPCRFDVDFATGELQSRPRLTADAFEDADELWHPWLDAAVVDEADGSTVLRTVDDQVLTRLPRGACAKAWFDDGRALLVTYPYAERLRLRIEVWRCRG